MPFHITATFAHMKQLKPSVIGEVQMAQSRQKKASVKAASTGLNKVLKTQNCTNVKNARKVANNFANGLANVPKACPTAGPVPSGEF